MVCTERALLFQRAAHNADMVLSRESFLSLRAAGFGLFSVVSAGDCGVVRWRIRDNSSFVVVELQERLFFCSCFVVDMGIICLES